MAMSNNTRNDFSWKKFNNRQFTTTDKAWYEEYPGKLLNIHKNTLWVDEIPSHPPVSTNKVIEVINTTLTVDNTVSNNRAWKYCRTINDLTTHEGDFIPPSYGQLYTVRIFDNDNNEIPTTDPSNWFFDYENGTLFFENNPSDYGWSLPLKIMGYRYIGNINVVNYNIFNKSVLIPYYGNIYTNGNYDSNIIKVLDTVIKYPDVLSMIVVKIDDSGPGLSVNNIYKDYIKLLKSRNILTLGYVNARDIEEAKTLISRWKTLYPDIDGIFITSPNANDDAFAYKRLKNFTHSKNLFPFIYGNVVTNSDLIHLDALDLYMVYQDSNYPNFADKYTSDIFNNLPVYRRIALLKEVSYKPYRMKKIISEAKIVGYTNDNAYNTIPNDIHMLYRLIDNNEESNIGEEIIKTIRVGPGNNHAIKSLSAALSKRFGYSMIVTDSSYYNKHYKDLYYRVYGDKAVGCDKIHNINELYDLTTECVTKQNNNYATSFNIAIIKRVDRKLPVISQLTGMNFFFNILKKPKSYYSKSYTLHPNVSNYWNKLDKFMNEAWFNVHDDYIDNLNINNKCSLFWLPTKISNYYNILKLDTNVSNGMSYKNNRRAYDSNISNPGSYIDFKVTSRKLALYYSNGNYRITDFTPSSIYNVLTTNDVSAVILYGLEYKQFYSSKKAIMIKPLGIDWIRIDSNKELNDVNIYAEISSSASQESKRLLNLDNMINNNTAMISKNDPNHNVRLAFTIYMITKEIFPYSKKVNTITNDLQVSLLTSDGYSFSEPSKSKLVFKHNNKNGTIAIPMLIST